MPLRSLFRKLLRSSRGAALVEFGIVVPMFILIFATVIEGGRIMWSYQSVIAGVRDATRYVSRTAPVNVCGAGQNLTYDATQLLRIVRDDRLPDGTTQVPSSIMPTDVTVNSVTATRACVTRTTGSFRISPVPVVTVTAEVRIDLPFGGMFRILGGNGLPDSITTTVSDSARMYGR